MHAFKKDGTMKEITVADAAPTKPQRDNIRKVYVHGAGDSSAGVATVFNLRLQGIKPEAFIDENTNQIEPQTGLPILNFSKILCSETKPYIIIADLNVALIYKTIAALEQHGLVYREDFDFSIFVQFYYKPHQFTFVIYAPPYDENSGGAIVLHELNRLLIKHEFNSKICVWGTERALPPLFSHEIIVVYPEVVDGNPLKAKNIVRWLLNKPNAFAHRADFTENELTFCFNKCFNDININPDENTLTIFHCMWETYRRTNFGKRSGCCYLIRKGKYRDDLPKAFDGPVIDGKSHEEIAQIFNECEYCISYDTHTAYTVYARICGCIPIVIPDNSPKAIPILTKHPWIAYGNDPEEILRSRNSESSPVEYFESMEKNNDGQILNFIDICKRNFGIPEKATQYQSIAPQPSSALKAQEPFFQLDRGIQAFNDEDHETAIECLSTAMTQESDNPLPYAYLSFVCAQQGLLQEARDFIAQTTKIAPERADLIAALGEVLLKKNNPSEAAKYLREAVHAQPDLFVAYPAFAQSLHLTGQSEEAISILQTVAALPSNAQASIQSTLLQILAECGDLSGFTDHTLRFSAGLPDDLLAARCLMRFDESGETFIEILARIQARMEEIIHSNRDNATQNESGLTRIAFMLGDFTSYHQLTQLYALLRYLPAERFSTLLIFNYTHPPKEDLVQMCILLSDNPLSICQDEDDEAIERLRALAPDILINMEVCAPSERLAVFLAAPVPHKFLWGEFPMPPIAPDVRTLAGERFAVENMLPTVNLPEMGELFDLPELPFTDDAAPKVGEPPVLGCLVPAAGIGRNGWQLFAEVLRQLPEATLVINLEELGQQAQTFISRQFSSAGVDPTRLVFISVHSAEELCLTWQSIDLGLLPPVNPGGLALPTCLWMGRPCLIPGTILPWSQRPAALLKALGKEEWIAIGERHFVDLARQLAPSSQRITPDPALRERMKALGLTDAEGFARGFAEAMTLQCHTHPATLSGQENVRTATTGV